MINVNHLMCFLLLLCTPWNLILHFGYYKGISIKHTKIKKQWLTNIKI